MDWSARALVFVIALTFVGAFAPRLMDTGLKDKTTLIAFIIPGLLVVLAIIWPRLLTGTKLGDSATKWASDFRTWLGLFLLVWTYAATMSVIWAAKRDKMVDVIKNDMMPFRAALEKWVIPRRLAPEQIQALGDYLAKFPPTKVRFEVREYDEEASGLKYNIGLALARGGWPTGETVPSNSVADGLQLHFQSTEETRKKRSKRTPRDKFPAEIMQEAFVQAGVQFDGTGGGSGADTTEDILTIRIGPRRRDVNARPQKWYIP